MHHLFSGLFKIFPDTDTLIPADDKYHADTAIEGTQQFFFRNVSCPGKS